MRVVVTHLSGSYRGGRGVFESERLTIGRGRENDIRLGRNDTLASAHHAELTLEGETWYLRDLGSTNGTFVDGRRVERAKVRGGETLAFGYGGPQIVIEFIEELPDERPSLDEWHEFAYRADYSRIVFGIAAALAAVALVAVWRDLVLVAIPASLGAALFALLGFAFVRVNITVGPEGIEHQGVWRTTRLAWYEIDSLETRESPDGRMAGARCFVHGEHETIEFAPADYREGYLVTHLVAEASGREWHVRR